MQQVIRESRRRQQASAWRYCQQGWACLNLLKGTARLFSSLSAWAGPADGRAASFPTDQAAASECAVGVCSSVMAAVLLHIRSGPAAAGVRGPILLPAAAAAPRFHWQTAAQNLASSTSFTSSLPHSAAAAAPVRAAPVLTEGSHPSSSCW